MPNDSLAIRNRLHTAVLCLIGLPAVPASTALLHQAHLRCCRQHVRWNLNMWTSVMFSGGSRFCRRHSDCRVKVWRICGECFSGFCTDGVTSFGGGSVMVWGGSVMVLGGSEMVWGGISLSGKTWLITISVQRGVEMKFCNQWQSYVSTVWDQTPPTALTSTKGDLSEITSRIWEWKGWHGPASSPDLNTIFNTRVYVICLS